MAECRESAKFCQSTKAICAMQVVNDLPENILLEIFTYLPMKERCAIARVCKKWKRISLDNELWRHVDFRPYRIKLLPMWKLMRSKFSPALRSLYLCGYLQKASTTTSWKKNSLSDAMLAVLCERSPNLRMLCLTHTNLSHISLHALPSSLTTLALTHCQVPGSFYNVLEASAFLSSLSSLDLSHTTQTSDAVLQRIASAWRALRALSLTGCYRVTGVGLKAVAEGLTQLTELNVSGTLCDDLAVHHLCRGLSALESLDISECMQIRAGSVAVLRTAKHLRELRVRGIHWGAAVGLEAFEGFKSLRLLDVRNTDIVVDSAKRDVLHFTIETTEKRMNTE